MVMDDDEWILRVQPVCGFGLYNMGMGSNYQDYQLSNIKNSNLFLIIEPIILESTVLYSAVEKSRASLWR